MLKKRKKEVIGTSEALPEGIFGDTSVPESVRTNIKVSKRPKLKQKTTKKFESSRGIKARVMPEMEINYSSRLPKEAAGLKINNVVEIPVPLLQSIRGVTNARTQKLSELLLKNTTPTALSFDAASSYVKAVLSDGLKIDVDVDHGVMEVVRDLGRLDVIFFFVKRLRIPKSLKDHYMKVFIDELAKASLENMRKSDKNTAMSAHIRELEGVIAKRSSNKIEHRTRNEVEEVETPIGTRMQASKRARGVR